MEDIKRRDFLKKTALAAAASAAALSLNAPAVHARKTHSWRMVTTWPPGFPVLKREFRFFHSGHQQIEYNTEVLS